MRARTRRARKLAPSIPLALALGMAGCGGDPAPLIEFDPTTVALGPLRTDTVHVVLGEADTVQATRTWVAVPERHDRPEGRRIAVTYLHIPATAPSSQAPIVVLAGGPGISGIDLVYGPLRHLYNDLRQQADVVLFDQRGTGRSVPSLRCEEQLGLPTDADAARSDSLVHAAIARSIGACADRLRAEGVDLDAYHSLENASDIDALRAALGAERIALVGHSYGSELAMVYARAFPERVDRMVFVGAVSPDLSLKVPAEIDVSFRALSALAVAQGVGGQALDAQMRRVHERLQGAPVDASVPMMDALDANDPKLLRGIFRVRSVIQPRWKMEMSALHLQLMVQDRVGSDDFLGEFPRLYAALDRGEYREIGNVLRNFRRRTLPNALLFTTNCATGATPERAALAAADQGTLFTAGALGFARSEAVCGAVGVPTLPAGFLAPITSPHPVLLIGGTLDGRTPIAHHEILRKRFPAAERIVVENGAHTALIDPVVGAQLAAFLRGDSVTVHQVQRTVNFAPVETADSYQAGAAP